MDKQTAGMAQNDRDYYARVALIEQAFARDMFNMTLDATALAAVSSMYHHAMDNARRLRFLADERVCAR